VAAKKRSSESEAAGPNLSVIYEPFRIFESIANAGSMAPPGSHSAPARQANSSKLADRMLLQQRPASQQASGGATLVSARLLSWALPKSVAGWPEDIAKHQWQCQSGLPASHRSCQKAPSSGATEGQRLGAQTEGRPQLNRLQRALLRSLQRYSAAAARYELMAAQRRRAARERASLAAVAHSGSQFNLNRTTQAIRRGSVVVLAKLKLLSSGPQSHLPHSHQQHSCEPPTDEHTAAANGASDGALASQAARPPSGHQRADVPSLSLTKAEWAPGATSPAASEPAQGPVRSPEEAGGPAADCVSTRTVEAPNLWHQPAAKHQEPPASFTRHSIGHLPDGQGAPACSPSLLGHASATTGNQSARPDAVCVNLEASSCSLQQCAGGKASNVSLGGPSKQQLSGRPSLIGSWFFNLGQKSPSGAHEPASIEQQQLHRQRAGPPSGRHSTLAALAAGSHRNSCFSQASLAAASDSSESTEDVLAPLARPQLARRRSFSGPFQWLERQVHRNNLLTLDSAGGCSSGGRKQANAARRRSKKMKPQKSNSSDYHSLNNRRIYRLDSRGFQTKLKGTFYVITNDPLAGQLQFVGGQSCGALDSTSQHRATVQMVTLEQLSSYGYDWAHPQQQQQQYNFGATNELKNSSNEMEESSFFNSTTNGDENSASICAPGASNETSFERPPSGESAAPKVAPKLATHQADSSRLESARGGQKSTGKSRHQKRTFLVYFHWTQWMIARRNYSLFLFSPKSPIRRFCLAVTNRKEFDYFVLFFISMNCVTLAMERPRIPPYSKEREFLTMANYYFTFMFTLEMCLKVIAKGLYYGRDAYLSDSWNIMDGSLVGFSLFDVLLSIVADRSPRIFAILRVFRLLRSLRPLRVINRLMGLKLVVQTLLLSLRPIGNIVLICCTFFIIFGILGVQLFKGTFYYCDGPDPLEIMRTVKTKDDCLLDHRNRWINRKYNFDNLGQALMALFVLSSKDGWVNIMYTGLDAVGVDIQPRENYNEWRLLYFISFLLLVAFFVLNMFVGVVVENFHRCRKEQELEEKARRAEKRQRKLDKRRRRLREPPYYANYGRFRLLLHKWVTGGYFDLLIAAVIGFNVVFMSLEHYQMPPELIHLLKVSNYVFTAAFIMEAAIKISALGMRRYLKDRWNQLDVAIVAMSVIGIIFEEMDSFTLPINPTLLRVLRVMRIARVLKLLKMAKGIRALLDTVMQALPQVGNLGLLFFLLFFIFAALGVELFGRLECNEEYPCSGLMDQHAHFQNFGLAFLTLFRVATGDNWNGIMKDTLRDKCDPSSNCLRNCCVSQLIAPLYFVVFVLLAQFVLVNVVVAVLMKHLEESHHEMEIDEEYELDKQLAEELEAKRKALIEARERQNIYWC